MADDHALELAMAGGVQHWATRNMQDLERAELAFTSPWVPTPPQHRKAIPETDSPSVRRVIAARQAKVLLMAGQQVGNPSRGRRLLPEIRQRVPLPAMNRQRSRKAWV